MAILSELRYPTTRLAKLFSAILALILFVVVSITAVSGFLLYQILRPARNPSTADLGIMMGQPATFSFSIPGEPDRDGWFFPGLRGAPTIIVCHGYMSQRTEVLTLASALQEHQYNVFLFDFAGHGATPGVTTLGYKETTELRAAVQALSQRDDVDPAHFGLWGIDMGGYAVLAVAESDPRIAAFVVDNAYPDPLFMVETQVKRSGLSVLPAVTRFTDFGFRVINHVDRNVPPITLRLARTAGVPKLFIQTDDRPALENATLQIYLQAPEPKQTIRQHTSYSEMSDDDRHAYENQLVSFFLTNLPAAPRN
ncbi:MAG: alpha/beta fold hydrolase [Candidatus Acidiferrales bacterium]